MLHSLLGGHAPHRPLFGLKPGFEPRGRGRCGRRGRRGPWAGCARRRAPGGVPRGKLPHDHARAARRFGAAVVDASVTLGDGAVVLPEQVVIKTWRVKNDGAEAWPEGTVLKYVGKRFNPLVNGASFPVAPVQAGEEGNVSVVLEAPQEGGEYRCRWRLETPDGQTFGQPLVARVVVAGPRTERVACQCGQPLLETQAQHAYEAAAAACDGCGCSLRGADVVHHCAGGRNHLHPHGFDLCAACHRAERLRQEWLRRKLAQPVWACGKPAAVPGPEPEPEMERKEEEAEEEEEPREALLSMFRDADLAAMRAQQGQEAEQLPTLSADEEPEPAPAPKPYKYAAQLAKIHALGFDVEEEAVKVLLEQHGGRVDVVVHALLGV